MSLPTASRSLFLQGATGMLWDVGDPMPIWSFCRCSGPKGAGSTTRCPGPAVSMAQPPYGADPTARMDTQLSPLEPNHGAPTIGMQQQMTLMAPGCSIWGKSCFIM